MTTAYTVSNPVAMGALPTTNGVIQRFTVNVTNTSDATYAPDGLAAAPIYGLGGLPLQGTEMVANSIATLVSYIGPLLNSGSLCWILFDCTAGAQQVAAASASQHAVQFGQVSGVVGQVRNAKMSVTTASASATFTADEIIVETALGGLRYCLPSFSKTINLATTGAGGMDTGSAPVSGFVALYAIYNPTTATAALLATNTTSAAAPSIYGGANMPSGYIASALIGVWPTNSSKYFGIGYQQDRTLRFPYVTAYTTTTNTTTPTSISFASYVPKNALSMFGTLDLACSTSAALNGTLASDANNVGRQYVTTGGQYACTYFECALETPQTAYYTSSTNGGTLTFTVFLVGYSF
ncbi:hypothetical protein [Herbaspirillum rubrisubalbicans]|uniref:hypothetical protein n=1 Tax=Herbaspirillum rubrisubalbicans TaxID=80842 RepID=UPI0002E760F9|nr:hypothetical protein [Herbaspirillum rubrisubalbicans]